MTHVSKLKERNVISKKLTFQIFSACASHLLLSLSSLIVLRRMFNCVITRLVSCPDDPAL